jgi:hypothetical protein
LPVKAHRPFVVFTPTDFVYPGGVLVWLAAADIAHDVRQNVSSGSLGSGDAVRLYPDRHQTENGNQTKSGDPQSECQLDKRKRGFKA